MALQYPILSGLLALISLAALPAQQEKEVRAQDVQVLEEESIDTIITGFRARRNKWQADYRKAKTPEARKKLSRLFPRPNSEREKILKLALARPGSAAAAKGLSWVVQNQATPPQMKKALQCLSRHHIDRPDLDKVCKRLRYEFTSYAERFLRTVHEKNANKGIALYCVAKALQRRAAFSDDMKKAPDPQKYEEKYLGHYGAETVALLKRCNSASLRDEAEKLLEAVAEQFPNAVYREATLARKAILLADKVKAELFEIRNLAVGMLAPNIKGEDIDGVKFSLSDYRGKVVLLDFWGDW